MEAIRFSSKAGANVTMDERIALELIRMMGHSGAVPGAILGDKLNPALTALRQRLASAAAEQDETRAAGSDDDDDDDAQHVALSTRAFPLLQLMEAADKRHQDLMWERFTGVYIAWSGKAV